MVNYQTLKSKESNILVDTSTAAASAILVKLILAPFKPTPLLQNINHQPSPKQQYAHSIWRLTIKNMPKYVRNQALLFTLKDYICRVWEQNQQSTTTQHYYLMRFISGGLAGSISLLILYPLSFPKINLVNFLVNRNQNICQQPKGIIDKYKNIYKNSLIKQIYRGAAGGTLVTFIYRGLYFGMYDSFKPYIEYEQKNRRIKRLLLALTASSVASWTSNPIYSITRQLLVSSRGEERVDLWSVLAKYRQRMNSIWRGISKNWFSIGSAGLVLFIYDQLHEFRRYRMENI